MKKKFFLFLCILLVVWIFVFGAEIENTNLEQAFLQGKVRLIFLPTDVNNVRELTVKNEGGTPLLIEIPEGINTLTQKVNINQKATPQYITITTSFYAPQRITFELKCDSEFKTLVLQSEKDPFQGKRVEIACPSPEAKDVPLKEIKIEKNLLESISSWQKDVAFLTPIENPVQSLQGLTIEDIAFNTKFSYKSDRSRVIRLLEELGFQNDQLSQIKKYSECLYNELGKKPKLYIIGQEELVNLKKVIRIQFIENAVQAAQTDATNPQTIANVIAADQPIRIQHSEAPKRTYYVEPIYPEIALQARISGVVKVEVVIDVHGQIRDAHVVSGHPILNEAALNAVRQWTYEPYVVSGIPREACFTVSVSFSF